MRRARPLLLALLAAATCVWASGVFELQVLEFSNPRARLASGECCGGGGGGGGGACAAPCRARFTLCLKEYQASAGAAGGGAGAGAGGACSFGRASSPALGEDSFTLAEPLYTLALPFTFRWTRSFTLILQAFDDYNYTEPEAGLLAEEWWSGIVEPGAAWHALRGARAAYRVRVTCQPNYYNTTCTTFCRARDDHFGHYACSPLGHKRCLPGWRGDNCDIPVCKEGCHPTHGHCDKPGDCDCRPGWRGELCAQCAPYPGCKHGYCNGSSWDCTCDTNWGGILCDQDLNYCGTHEPCQHGGTCENTAPDQYLCTCAEGFSGLDCERADHPCAPAPCAHGACALAPDPPGFRCACEPGWTGALCDTDPDDCASVPCAHGATCRDRLAGFSCDCAPGWTGPTCEDDVDECAAAGGAGPCVNAAACVNVAGGFSCACLPGWAGPTCARNEDDCAGQCLHGATCIDLVADFHCACAAGWAGRTCARDVDECAPRPCRNGGECRDLLAGYRCICPVGFAGHDCEDDRDHCAGAPCANGAACYTAPGDYYCHCAPGWAGRNCTAPTAPAAPAPPPPAPAPPPPPLAPALAPCAGCRGRCVRAPHAPPRCLCEPGHAGDYCDMPIDACASLPCFNNATCVDTLGDYVCLCADGWTGSTCAVRAAGVALEAEAAGAWCTGACLAGGGCVRAGGGWACACPVGRAGARCELTAPDACASQPCLHGGRCVPAGPGAGASWLCECPPGRAGTRCELSPPCACPAPATCAPDARCVCPVPPSRVATRCLELIAGLDGESVAAEPVWSLDNLDGAGGECAGAGGNASWWWGCNVCWCGAGGAGDAQCTRLWCGLDDCLAAGTGGAGGGGACRGDEVCVPAAPALCLRAPCAAPGECRRVWARRVAPPALPAPPACWPGARAAPPQGCARLLLELARERLARGAHVERACAALRRALAATLAPRAAPLALLCDLAPDDDDALDLALWVGEEEGAAGAEALRAAVRALHELLARRRLAQHALLGAALRLRAAPEPAAAAPPATADAAAGRAGAGAALAGAAGALLGAAALGGAAALLLRRRRAAAERARCDEEKSNNLQNEENLRRYANPLREEPLGAAAVAAGVGAGEAGTAAPAPAPPALPALPRAHSLYKAQNADARNNTPPRAPDKDFAKRALAPPERLTVLV